MTVTPLRTSAPLRTLPVAVHPAPWETFHSWTLRLAERLGVEPIRALKATGYVTSHVRSRAELTAYGLTATDHAIAEMSRTTRAAEATLRATLLDVFDGGPITFGDYTPGKPGAVRRLA